VRPQGAVAFVTIFACGCGRIGFDLSAAETDGAQPDSAPSSVPPGDAAPADACGTHIVLADAFDSATPGPQWSIAQDADASVSQGSGAMTIVFAPMVQQNVLAGYHLASATSFANACVTVDLATVPNPSSNASVIFSVGSVNINVRFLEVGGSLQSLCESTSNSINHLDVRPYDPVAHRYLRLRNAGTVGWRWDVSSDGMGFTTVAANECAAVPTTNVLNLLAGATAGTSGDGDCRYASVSITN
jgi:hypothetical protein